MLLSSKNRPNWPCMILTIGVWYRTPIPHQPRPLQTSNNINNNTSSHLPRRRVAGLKALCAEHQHFGSSTIHVGIRASLPGHARGWLDHAYQSRHFLSSRLNNPLNNKIPGIFFFWIPRILQGGIICHHHTFLPPVTKQTSFSSSSPATRVF